MLSVSIRDIKGELVREAAKKVLFLVAGPLRGGGRAWPLKKVPFPLSSRGGGGKALVVRPLKKELFLRLP